MISRLKTIGLSGLETFSIDVEVTTRSGKPYFSIIGLGDNAVKEAKERVQAALSNSGFMLPEQTLVNLAPAEVKKEGASFDLAIALGMMCCMGQVSSSLLEGRLFLGELTLDGGIRAIRGALTLVLGTSNSEIREIIVPLDNLAEATLLSSTTVIGVSSLPQVISYLKFGEMPPQISNTKLSHSGKYSTVNLGFNDVWGQNVAKRALTIAAAAGHNILMVGPPGCGKSMLAQRFGALLPEPSKQETIEMVSIHSAMGHDPSDLISGARPFRTPHHSISEAGLIGGGGSARAGEITLSHGGTLFLDEFPEFRRSSIEAMRAPLENGHVTISRAKIQRTFPASFQLIAAMNPCPCGKFGYGRGKKSCLCSSSQIQKYIAKLSYPILDRIDLQVELEPIPLNILTNGLNSELSQNVDYVSLARSARERQLARSTFLNAKIGADSLRKYCKLSSRSQIFFEEACAKLDISARGFVRILRVARTIADIDDSEKVDESHIAEALSYRALTRIQAILSTQSGTLASK